MTTNNDGLMLRRISESEQSLGMLSLIQSFHALEHLPLDGIFDSRGRFDPFRFPETARKALHTEAELDCARFILFVWNSSFRPGFGRFDFGRAIVRWDAQHRAAFVAWAQEPWWP